MIAGFMTGYMGKTAEVSVETPEDQQKVDAEEEARRVAQLRYNLNAKNRKKELKRQLLILGVGATSWGILMVYRVIRHRKKMAKYKAEADARDRERKAYDNYIHTYNFAPPAGGSLSDVEQGAKYFSDYEREQRAIGRGESWPPTDMVDPPKDTIVDEYGKLIYP
jgi:hypothetical protein